MTERAKTSGIIPGIALFAIGCLVVWDGCRSAEDRYQKYAPRETGPVVETEPTPLKSCSPKPRPTAEVIPVAGAPLQVRLVRAYHLCLGKHVALLRLSGAKREIVQVVLEYERYDILGRRAPRRSTLPVTHTFSPKTVRYQRIEWREGRVNPDERGFRVRLAAVDFAKGKRWTAPTWPPSPAVLPPKRKVPGPLAPVDKIQKSLQGITGDLKKRRQKMSMKK